MTITEAHVRSIAICYSTDSLFRQVTRWGRKHADCAIEPVFARSALEIRRELEGADLVLVDATDDFAQAIEAFSQSVARIGSQRVIVYTERMHEELELFVRTQGAWLLLGPLGNGQWDDLFSHMLPPAQPEPAEFGPVRRRAA